MKRFEYTNPIVKFDGIDAHKQFQNHLNEYGNNGWELVTMSIKTDVFFVEGELNLTIAGVVYFKRPRE